MALLRTDCGASVTKNDWERFFGGLGVNVAEDEGEDVDVDEDDGKIEDANDEQDQEAASTATDSTGLIMFSCPLCRLTDHLDCR